MREAAQRRGHGGYGDQGLARHAGFGQNGRIDRQDVGHRRKCGYPGEDFLSNSAASTADLEALIEPFHGAIRGI